MITSIANNFGCGPIQIKDYQDDMMVVLNAKFKVNVQCEEYKNCDVLEIKVPNLSINKSAEAGCYMGASQLMWPDKSWATTYNNATCIKTWIKDKNTICIEKFGCYDSLDEITIWLCSMYPVVGQRGELKVYEKDAITYEAVQTQIRPNDLVLVKQPGWCFLHFYFYSTYAIKNGTPIEANLKGFPEDVDVDFPIIGGSHQAEVGGNLYCDAHIENGKFLVPEPDSRMTSTSYEPFVMIYAVRG